MSVERVEILRQITEYKIVAIARNVAPEDIAAVGRALYRGGVRLMEITFDQKGVRGIEDTVRSIQVASNEFGRDMVIGAGTVMTSLQLLRAYDAGAKFILSPNTDESIIRQTADMELVSIPGAFTPTEIAAAYSYGGDIIKLFPAGSLGTDYVKSLKGPLGHIPLMLVGGIYENNIREYMKIGIGCFGLGGGILKNEHLRARDFEAVTKLAKLYSDTVKD